MEKSIKTEKAIKVALAEYSYWQCASEQESVPNIDAICIGAIGAAANITAALSGFPPTHHGNSDNEEALRLAARFRAFLATEMKKK